MNESEFHILFKEYLTKEKEFPELSLLQEFRIGGGGIVDVLVVKQGTSSPVALFELKHLKYFKPLSAGQQIQGYLDALDVEIPAYLVSFSDDGSFDIHAYKGGHDFEKLNKGDFPKYRSIATKKSVEDIFKIENKKKKSLDGFQRTCYGLAVLVTFTLVSKMAGWITVSSEDLGLIGVIIALVIIPNAAKLKLLGVEYEAKKAEQGAADNADNPRA